MHVASWKQGVCVLVIACVLSGCSTLHPTNDPTALKRDQLEDYPFLVASDEPPAESVVTDMKPTTPTTGDAKNASTAASAGAEPARWKSILEALSPAKPSKSSSSNESPATVSSEMPSRGTSHDQGFVLVDPTEPQAIGSEPTETTEPTEPPIVESGPMLQGLEAVIARPESTEFEPPRRDYAAPYQGEAVTVQDDSPPITLHLNGVDARQALDMLSREAKINILVSSGVSGTVTATLREMSFDEALNAILRLCNLVAHRDGNNVFVYTPNDLPELDRILRVIPLDYASGEDVVDSITRLKGLLSPVGYAYAYVIDRTEADSGKSTDNRRTREAVVIQDAPGHVRRIEQYIREIDAQPRQVMIEAYILEVVLKGDLQHGVNFEELISIAGNLATIKTLGFASTGAFPPDPTIEPSGSGFFVKIDGKSMNALLEALKTTADAKTLAAPKVSVLNGQMAHIQIGEKLGYRDTTTQTQTASTQSIKFLELGTVLDVTPRITSANQVVLNVRPRVASGRINPQTELPEEVTTEVETNILLEDGQGMVIGGLIKETDTDIQKKIPYLGDIPYLGMLFQQRKKQSERKEVIVALIPRIAPYTPCAQAKDQLETIRATTPLFHGPLRRCPRPWEPTLRDALPERGDRL